jgi:hypothetical protein
VKIGWSNSDKSGRIFEGRLWLRKGCFANLIGSEVLTAVVIKRSVFWSVMCNPTLQRKGRAIAQAVSRWLPTAAAWVRARVRSCGICGEQSGTGAAFLRILRFPLPILTPPTAPHSSSIVRGWYSRPVSGRRTKWTQSHPTPRIIKKIQRNMPPASSGWKINPSKKLCMLTEFICRQAKQRHAVA